VERLRWDGPVFETSALSRQGTQSLVLAVMEHIDKQRQGVAEQR
jgi:putative protein kinase ArgK-like GTPase of G3E family